MRIDRVILLSALSALAACVADRPTGPTAVPVQAHLFAELDLSRTGPTPLYASSAKGINDSGVVVGWAQLTAADEPKAAVWRPPDYHVTILPDLGLHATSLANSIGNDGTIGRKLCDGDSTDVPCHPAYWRDGVLHQLAGLGEVNDVCPCDGHTLVGRTTVDERDHAAIWVDDILIDVGIPDDGHSGGQMVAVSNGYFVGNAYDGTVETYQTQHKPFRWSHATGWVPLGNGEQFVYDVNAQGSAVGGYDVLWPNGSNTPEAVDGNVPSLAIAINDNGVIAGRCSLTPPAQGVFFLPCKWTAATSWVQIGDDGAPNDINNSNEVVGTTDSSGRSSAILWRP